MKWAILNKAKVRYMSWAVISFKEVFSSSFHDASFKNVRSEWIQTTVTFVSLVLSIMAFIWLGSEYFFILRPEIFAKVFIPRLFLTIAIVLILLLSLQNYKNSKIAHILLYGLVVGPQLFYLAVLFSVPIEEYKFLLGYQIIPFLMVALLTVFPLTILENVLLASLSAGILLYVDYLQGNILNMAGLNDIWLFVAIWAISMLSNYTQLVFLIKLYRQASYDYLTGLVNRNLLIESYNNFVNNWNKNEPLACLMFDLDRFKHINDVYGHVVGDNTLRNFAKIMLRHFNEADVVSRYGGEEFVVFMPNTSMDKAVEVANEVRIHCENYLKENPEAIFFTVSAGVINVREKEKVQDVFNRVDAMLYEAKISGRNKVVSSADMEKIYREELNFDNENQYK